MADTLVERLTGQARAGDVPVTVNLVISDQALLGEAEGAHLPGHGPVPADLARRWVSQATRRALRRLYASPATGRLTGDGVGRALLPPRPGHPDRVPRPDLHHRVVRGPDPSHRPRRRPPAGRPHQLRERPGTLRGLQLRQEFDPPHHRSHAPPGPQPWALPSRAEIAFASLVLAS